MVKIENEERTQAPRKPQFYVVKAGDSLSKIAEALLGDGDRWPEILDANKSLISDPNRIQPGQKLTIPAK